MLVKELTIELNKCIIRKNIKNVSVLTTLIIPIIANMVTNLNQTDNFIIKESFVHLPTANKTFKLN